MKRIITKSIKKDLDEISKRFQEPIDKIEKLFMSGLTIAEIVIVLESVP